MLSVIDPRITYYEAQHIFSEVDTTKDGKIEFEEF
jgi:Ca2+-binding EF-hand superfamily protein